MASWHCSFCPSGMSITQIMPCRTVPYGTRSVTTNDFAPVLVHLQKIHHNLFFTAVPSCKSDFLCPGRLPACPPCPKLFSWLSTCTPAPELGAPRLLPACTFQCFHFLLFSLLIFLPKSYLLTFSQWKVCFASPPASLASPEWQRRQHHPRNYAEISVRSQFMETDFYTRFLFQQIAISW